MQHSHEIIEYKRGRRDTTSTAERMTWESRCGKYRVQQCKSSLDGVKRYYALVNTENGFRMLEHMKTYRTRKAAERALSASVKAQPLKRGGRARRMPKRKATG